MPTTGLEELNSRTAKALILAKELEVKLARLDDHVNATVEAFKLDMRQKKQLEESRKMAGTLVQVLKE